MTSKIKEPLSAVSKQKRENARVVPRARDVLLKSKNRYSLHKSDTDCGLVPETCIDEKWIPLRIVDTSVGSIPYPVFLLYVCHPDFAGVHLSRYFTDRRLLQTLSIWKLYAAELCIWLRFFMQCAEEFEAMCSNRKSSAEEPRRIGVDEITSMKITCMPFMWGYRQIRFVHVCTCACTEIDLVCLHMCMAMRNLVHISARYVRYEPR
jgi:hypothetical protein